jgi:hypothetical protein
MIPGAQGLQLLIKINKFLNVDISHGHRIKERINKGEKMINEKMIEAKGPNKVTFKELVQVSIQRLKDPKTSIYKKEQAAISLLAMADALDRHPEAMEGF